MDKNILILNNIDINDYDLNDLRNQISILNQNNRLFNNTIYFNIQYGNNKSKKYIDDLCQKLGILDIFKNLSDGLESNVGPMGDKLSGGQRQMISILRALCKKNKIILLDEPTSSLDIINKEFILKGIIEMGKESTLIMNTHDEYLLKYVDHIYRINNGKIEKI